MTKCMLVDATHPEETRVALVDGNRLSDFDFERTSKKQLKGNIYLAKVIRIEPSLQAAFVEYGGNRHGFLPFSEIHPDYFRIPMADRPHDEPAPEEEAEDDEDEIDSGEDETGEETQPPEGYEEHAEDEASESTDPGELGEAEAAELADTLVETVETPVTIETVGGYNEPSDSHTITVNVAANPVSEATFTIREVSHETANDLGLITDFGNAVVSPVTMAEAAPVETVGGETSVEAPPRIRRPRYKIQEVVKRRQVMLIQVVKEERGNKGAALTTFLSLAGRYCVLMPNTESGGGVSRKITSHQDRRRMKEMLDQLEIPEGMAVILRTAGMEQDPAEIQRDLEYLLRLWNNIREQTLQSSAPTLIYEEANLIKRSLRDLYARDLDEILVAGTRGYQLAVDFMRTIMPDQLGKVKPYEDPTPLFLRYNVEKQIDQLYSPTVQLRSGGYIVINPTEALVSIDVNSGRATRERHIESTALKTNLEAAEEIARQLRLRDLAGLVVIDFIDMEDGRNNAAVERRLKDAMRADRARLQIGRISPFGLLELSRQRLHPSLMEINFEKCAHCAGLGLVRSVDSAAISILRVLEEDGIKNGGGDVILHVPNQVALYILNQKRGSLGDIERRYGMQVMLRDDENLVPPDYKLERGRGGGESRSRGPAVNTEQVFSDTNRELPPVEVSDSGDEPADVQPGSTAPNGDNQGGNGFAGRRRGRYGFRRGRGGAGGGGGRRDENNGQQQPYQDRAQAEPNGNEAPAPYDDADDSVGNVEPGQQGQPSPEGQDQDGQRRGGRRRGRRGGRGRRSGGGMGGGAPREGGRDNYRGDGNREGGRDGNRPPRSERPQGNWNNEQPARAETPMAAPQIPASIHDIDTTPRDRSASQVQEHSTPVARSTPASSSPYQVVSEASSDKTKGGWWRKLTGQ